MRDVIQAKLEEIEDIDVGELRSDDVLENEVTYFGYSLTSNFVDSDMDKTYEMMANINGYVSRLDNREENTLMLIDEARKKIIEKLKELNFMTTWEDVSIDNGVRKVHIVGNAVAQDDIIIGGE